MKGGRALDGGSLMSHVSFKKWQSMSNVYVAFSTMSHIEFKKKLCHMSLYF